MATHGSVRIGLAFLALLATLIPMPLTSSAVAYVVLAPMLCLVIGLVLAVLPTAGLGARLEAWARVFAAAVARTSPRRFAWGLAAASLLTGALVSVTVMELTPGVIDGAVYLLQAQILESGRLYADAHPLPEFFPAITAVVDGGRWYAQYPPGYPSVLALGVRAGLPWLVNPLIGALNAVLVYALGRELATEGEARLAALLAGFSPFVLLMGSDYTSHPTSLLCATSFMLCVARGIRGGGAGSFAAAGLAGAFAIATRPFSAIGICLPFALVAVFWLLRNRRWSSVLAAAAAAAVPLALFLLYNWGTTGDPFVLGYTKQHGVGHSPGFGQKMWGVHTPLMGLRLSLTNLNAFNKDFLQLPFPAAAPVALLFALGRPTRWDALLLVSFFFLSGLHTLYPRQTLYLGPKFLLEGVSVVAVLAARGFAEGARHLEPWMRDERHRNRMVWTVAVALLVVFPLVLGARLWTVRNGYSDPTIVRTVAAADLRDAVVFVPEPKGRRFAAAFGANTLGLDGPVVYAADRGEENARLLTAYPGRTAWVWRGEGLVPLEEAYR